MIRDIDTARPARGNPEVDSGDEPVECVAFDFQADPTRRDVLQFLGAGLLIAVIADPARAQPPSGGRRGGGGGPGRGGFRRGASTLSARLHIGNDGVITVMTGKVECGQGSRAELTQAAAEELRVAPGQVRLVMADTSLTPDDGVTAGSQSTPSTVPASVSRSMCQCGVLSARRCRARRPRIPPGPCAEPA